MKFFVICMALGMYVRELLVSHYSPNGKKFRSKPQLARYLGDALDLATFDFRSGKINSLLLRKNKKQRGTQFDYR
jgi:methyl-CpG-binding domain protein 2